MQKKTANLKGLAACSMASVALSNKGADLAQVC
jgi:hypothetical protein